MDDTAPVSQQGELDLIKLEIKSLEDRLAASRIRQQEIEKSLMSKKADDLLEKLLLFKEEIKSGNYRYRFMDVKKSIDEIKAVDTAWPQFLVRHYEPKPEIDRQERAFLINFCEQMAKSNKDVGDAVSYLASRRRPNNPFLRKGLILERKV